MGRRARRTRERSLGAGREGTRSRLLHDRDDQVGDVCRFRRAKHIASYLGLIPREHSSGGKQRMGGISKQGNPLLRFLLVEAANIAVRFDPVLRKEYVHRCHHKHSMVAKVAAARKLAIRLYWILRTQTPYPQVLSSRVA